MSSRGETYETAGADAAGLASVPASPHLSHAPAPGWGGLWVTACPRVCCVHHLLRLSATPASSVIVDRPVWSSLFVHSSSSSLVNADEEVFRGFK